jgi:TRAP-type C4-dicarboxylate transport system substrate-binding protein
MMKNKLLMAGLALAVCAGAPANAGEALHLSVVSGLPTNHTAIKIFRDRFQAEVTRRLMDAKAENVGWDETHAGTLAHFGGVLEAVEDDLAMSGIISVNHETRRLPLQNMTYQAPFSSESCNIVGTGYHAVDETVEGMTAPITVARQTYLTVIASDSYNFMAVQKIRNAADVRGIPIGVSERLDTWLYGVDGVPVRIPAEDLNARLEEGVLIGVLASTTDMQRLRFKQHADHYTRTGFGAQVPYVVTVNSQALRGLPEKVRKAVLETADTFAPVAARDYCAAGAKALETLKAMGVQTAKLLESRRIQWADTMGPLAQIWAAQNDQAGRPGTNAIAAYMNHLTDSGVKLIRDWTIPAPRGAIAKLSLPAEKVSRNAAKQTAKQ